MGRFGAVSYRQVRMSESYTSDENENEKKPRWFQPKKWLKQTLPESVSKRLFTETLEDEIELRIKEGGKTRKEVENDLISQIPLSQLSVTNINNIRSKESELALKKPGWVMAGKMIKLLLPYYWAKGNLSLKIRVIVCVSIIFASKLLNLYTPILFKNIINNLPAHVPWHWLVAYGLCTLVQKCIWDIRDLIFQDVSDNAVKHINLETFDHLFDLSLSYHLNKRTGSLIKIVERGANSVVQLLSLLLFNIFPTLLELFTVTVFLLFSYGSAFAVINLFSCLLYIGFTLFLTEWRTQHRRLANKKENEASDIKVDSLMNFETIKYFTAEAHERKRYETSLNEYFYVNKKSKVSYFILNFGQAFIIIFGSILGLSLAVWRAAEQPSFSTGDIIAINLYIAQMFAPLSWLGTSYRMILQSFTDIEQLFDLLHTAPDVADSPDATELNLFDHLTGHTRLPSVEFKDVHFSYKSSQAGSAKNSEGNVDVIKGVSFSIPAGKSVALVGSSGGGKSTLFRLLCRFYDVDQGEILVDGQNVKNLTQLSLRKIIGVVPQDIVLFNDTIAYNIGFGNRNATDDQIIEAAKRSQIMEFINKSPEGFKTVVGERGLRLSTGEKQRVSIARALLKNPPILILDEATSSLDTFTERNIQNALNEVSYGRTTLVIAHRLSTIVNCDEIIVLKKGVIAERGTHNQLLELNGEYALLWNEQASKKATNTIPIE
ncbi:hypothetical protein DICPUDRAFT_152232 [Dictyostelium purpureum]|uniref:ABC transporter B family protein n=1 Tax=Dictyostelium purpureum TaxID=5786 RepID=F0ZKT7_DICPU|nr:uncharacterized protein DICPUDRAFT_152232 [Dictyostelium purpureum]EGC35436.1 hypothetical protein DICPUDRAFT_152232 [Dictyostelium purpureum]|eukprot:XP_003288049.1 hypothetical protein DICPUDRAFT_152232 [Dictyostelium purpureum]